MQPATHSTASQRPPPPAILVLTAVLLFLISGCGPSAADLAAVDYTPTSGADWPVSTPASQGLDPDLVAKLYYQAEQVDTNKALLIIKDGTLIAERYQHGGSIDEQARLQSVTKSITSALTGIALARGCFESLDQEMMTFFPELEGKIDDPRKAEITVKELLQMRAGYPWEESSPELFEMLYHGFWPSLLIDVPLVRDPGSGMEYSNLTAHLAGIVAARACGSDLESLADESLFGPMNIERGEWIKDWEGNNNGHADLFLRARDMAKFGQLYLDDGQYQGRQLVPAEWVADSLKTSSQDAWPYSVGRNFNDIGYGYLWWSVRAGDHHYNLAWGHGGQQIALLDDYNMVIVVVADPLVGQHGDAPWKAERANLNLVADFIASLPTN